MSSGASYTAAKGGHSMALKRYRHKGKRIKKVTHEQRRNAYRAYSRAQSGNHDRKEPSTRAAGEKQSGTKGRIWQMVASAAILIAVIALKLIAPQTLDQFRGQLLDLMGTNTDFTEVFSAVGRAVGTENGIREVLNDAYVAVFGTEGADDEEESADKNDPYSERDIPGNACLSQKILGFSYAKPLEGQVSDSFGYRSHPIEGENKFHYGLDIEAEEGTVITAFADGTVTAVGESSVLGKYVTVQHANGYATLYAHCSRITASSGQQVRTGDPIAEVGQTGQATGPHLHFELQLDAIYINPIYYVTE